MKNKNVLNLNWRKANEKINSKKFRNNFIVSVSALMIMVTMTSGVNAASWRLSDTGKLSNSQGTAYIYKYSDEGIKAQIDVVGYKTSDGKDKYL